MNVLTVIPTMGIGGAETIVELLGRDALSRGERMIVASAGGFRADALADAGAQLWPLPLTGRRPADLARAVRRLRVRAARTTPDVVHAHNVKAAVVARVACGRGVPIVATVHGLPARDYPNAARLLRLAADHVVAVSPHVADELCRHGLPAAKTSIVENALVPAAVRPRTEARDRLGVEPHTVVVLCAARMTQQKRHDLLIDAWAAMPSHARLVLAGDGPLRTTWEARAADAIREGRIRFLGQRSDVDWLLAASDLVVLPTDWEGLPMNVLEAMAAGRPVVASRVAGLLGHFDSAARLVEPGSASALAEAIGDLVADPVARAELAERGRRLVGERFAPEPMLTAYADLLGRHAARSRARSRGRPR